MTASEKQQWIEGKGKGKRLFGPELGGSYEVFNEGPLPEEIALYCTQDEPKAVETLLRQAFSGLGKESGNCDEGSSIHASI